MAAVIFLLVEIGLGKLGGNWSNNKLANSCFVFRRTYGVSSDRRQTAPTDNKERNDSGEMRTLSTVNAPVTYKGQCGDMADDSERVPDDSDSTSDSKPNQMLHLRLNSANSVYTHLSPMKADADNMSTDSTLSSEVDKF